MALFGWGREVPSEEVLDARAGADALLQALDKVVATYLEKADHGDLVYPACKRKSNDASASPREIWRHTRLEGMRYLTMIPGRDSALLTEPSRQAELIDGFLRQQPHEDTVIDFTGRAVDDVAIAIIAGLNWLNHCALLAKVDRAKASGTLRNFRRVVTVAQQWWGMEGAEARCRNMQQARELPPLMLNLVWLECTHLAKDITAAAVFGASGEASDASTRFQAALDPDEPAA
ncbi:hypothetical protein AAFX91_40510 [Bradyrhizobium sp. 31Argb]|uniref:hypothetical protein n=1 Tax=Bradyrhizobium sp. 31Argb TaxID=3141247 RepID=UPI0037492FCB